MSKYFIEDTTLISIADAIRSKDGTSEPILTEDMASRIEAIPSGGDTSIEDGLIDGSLSGEYVNNRVKIIRAYAFMNCDMTSVHLDGLASSLTATSAFHNCTNLKEATFENLPSINAGNCFNGCTSLEKVNMPKATTLNGASAFAKCSALITLNMPLLTAINCNSGFNECLSLTKLIKENLPNLQILGNNSFANSGVQTVDLPLTNIGSGTFKNCPLYSLILRDNGTDKLCVLSNVNGLEGTGIANGEGYIYVPQALIEEYKAATNWVTYASQIRAIEDYPDVCGESEVE